MDKNELADELDSMGSSAFFGPDKDALRQAAAALRESEELRRDAERYRFLRGEFAGADSPYIHGPLDDDGLIDGEAADIAIDAAIDSAMGEMEEAK